MEYEGIIYRYKSPSGKYYIGQTMDEYERRRHFLMTGSYSSPKIDNARKKYGPENFEYTVLVRVTGDNPEEVKKHLNTLEIGFIRMYDSYKNGYNSTEGGGGTVGRQLSEEAKRRIGSASKERRTGCKMSIETKLKISKSMVGIKRSEETKKKISTYRKGHLSEETKKKISTYRKGHLSEETRRKMSESHKGKKRGPYNKKKDGIPLNPLW